MGHAPFRAVHGGRAGKPTRQDLMNRLTLSCASLVPVALGLCQCVSRPSKRLSTRLAPRYPHCSPVWPRATGSWGASGYVYAYIKVARGRKCSPVGAFHPHIRHNDANGIAPREPRHPILSLASCIVLSPIPQYRVYSVSVETRVAGCMLPTVTSLFRSSGVHARSSRPLLP